MSSSEAIVPEVAEVEAEVDAEVDAEDDEFIDREFIDPYDDYYIDVLSMNLIELKNLFAYHKNLNEQLERVHNPNQINLTEMLSFWKKKWNDHFNV